MLPQTQNHALIGVAELKEILWEVRKNKFLAPSNLHDVLNAMFTHIGTTDAELRDKLIYGTFVQWIEFAPVISPKNLIPILDWAVANLEKGISETEDDSVFTRSFSVLLIPLIVARHRDHAFLKKPQLVALKERLLWYLDAERDLRGFVPDKGWAHAVAHAADALNELALCDELDADDLVEIMNAVRDKVSVPVVYTHAEDERLVEVIDSIYSRELVTGWQEWLSSFVGLVKKSDYPDGYARYINIKNFLQSLYYRAAKNDWQSLQDMIDARLDAILEP